MAVLCAGSESASFLLFNAEDSTTAGKFSEPARAAILINKNGFARTPKITVATDNIWLHFDYFVTNITDGFLAVAVYDNDGTELVGMLSPGVIRFADLYEAECAFLSNVGLYTVDLNLNATTGACRVLIGGTEVFSRASWRTTGLTFAQAAKLPINTIVDVSNGTSEPIDTESPEWAAWSANNFTGTVLGAAPNGQQISFLVSTNVGTITRDLIAAADPPYTFNMVSNTPSINVGTLRDVEFRPSGLNVNDSDSYVSQVIVANESTVGWKLVTLEPSGGGAQTSWAGNYTDVSELPANLDTNLSAPEPGRVETWVNTAIGNYDIRAVISSVQANRVSENSPTVQSVIRISGANHVNNLDVPVGYYGPAQAVQNTNPATGGAWTSTAINGAEFGVKST